MTLRAAAGSADSLAVATDTLSGDALPSPSLKRWVPVAAGGAMVAAGAIGRAASPSWSFRGASAAENGFEAVDAVQYLPLAFPWVMKLAGAPTRSSWGRMAVSQGIGVALMAGTVYGLKHVVDAPRPDGSDNRSFPSGHTAWAFLGATAVAHELGQISPWYTVGAYALATGVGVSRVIDKRHFPTDVVAGAGVGVITAQLGYYIGDIIFRNNQLDNRTTAEWRRNDNMSFVSLSTGMAIPMGHISIGDGNIIRMPALTAAIHGGVAIDDAWGATAELTLQSTPIQIEQQLKRTAVGCLNSLGVLGGGYYRRPLSALVDVSAAVSGGYFYNFDLNSVDDAVTAGRGTAVGRVSLGAGLRLSDNFKCQATIGYQLSGYRFDIAPSSVAAAPTPDEPPYNITCRDSRHGLASTLLLGLNTAITF